MTRFTVFSLLVFAYTLSSHPAFSQGQAVHPSFISTGTFLGVSPPLRDLPRMTDADWQAMKEKAEEEQLNEDLGSSVLPLCSDGASQWTGSSVAKTNGPCTGGPCAYR